MEGNEIQQNTSETVNPKSAGSFWDIFLEPAKCFEGINVKPAFIIPLILCILVTFASSYVIYSKVDMAQVMREQIESRSAGSLDEEQIAEQIRIGTKIGRISALVAPFIMIPLFILLIAGLMMLGIYVTGSDIRGKSAYTEESKSCGKCGKTAPLESRIGDHCPHCGVTWGNESKIYDGVPAPSGSGGKFSRVFAVAAVSMLFYSVVGGILTITVVLVAADPNTINIQNPVFTNPAGLVDLKESKVLYTFLSHLDVLVWYTIFLMGLGLSRVATKCTVAKGVFLIGIWYGLYAAAHTGLALIL